MGKRILLLNSDIAKNRGDRAITEGITELIREQLPDASITGISQYPERDTDWFGIDFINMNFQSLNPIDMLRLCAQAKKHDYVLWGGGEILKDYTNKAALWYWVLKITIIRLFNPHIYGAYQGIGPTKSALSKRLIAFVVNRTKYFVVRDEESYETLLTWGAERSRLRWASDPAVLPVPASPSKAILEKLSNDFDIPDPFLKNFICIGPRDWFHYKKSGILPFKYRRKLMAILGKREAGESPEHARYTDALSTLVTSIIESTRLNILLVPMHMEEDDTKLCQQLADSAQSPERVRVLSHDTLSPSNLRGVLSLSKAMIGFRLHSNIIAVSSGVPSMNIYYVDKGRVFFDQINQQAFAHPIEDVLEDGFAQRTVEELNVLLDKSTSIQATIRSATSAQRAQVRASFKEMINEK